MAIQLSLIGGNVTKLSADEQARDEASVRAVHDAYFQALGSGDMDALAKQFTFPAAFKGFLDDVAIATDKDDLVATYEKLIAAAPKAARSNIHSVDFATLRPNVYMLTMNYEQFGPDDTLIHEGKAMYFVKKQADDYKLFAVF
mgnify:FL=1